MNKKTGVILLIILILTGVLGYYTYTNFFVKKTKEEVKEVSKIDNYGYTLYDNQSKDIYLTEPLNNFLLNHDKNFNSLSIKKNDYGIIFLVKKQFNNKTNIKNNKCQ